MDWSYAVAHITPYVVRIETQQVWGTGFIFWQNDEYCCIATAKHVIENANQDGWEQPIYFVQPSGRSLRLNPEHRRIVADLNADIQGDSAAILIRRSGLDLPGQCLPLWDFSQEIPIGTEVGWLGYPAVVDKRIIAPSFFSGTISNLFPDLEQYAIDGVAISGVSGGPLFRKPTEGPPHVIGTISSYFPNWVERSGAVGALPGIAVSHSFSAFATVIADLNIEDNG